MTSEVLPAPVPDMTRSLVFCPSMDQLLYRHCLTASGFNKLTDSASLFSTYTGGTVLVNGRASFKNDADIGFTVESVPLAVWISNAKTQTL